ASVDVLKSLLVNGETDLAATPSYAAANLFNKGVPVRLVAMQVWGMLYVIGPSGSAAQGLEALRGQQVGVPLPGNMPDLVFRYLLGQKGWNADSDLTIAPYPDGQGALNALLTGEIDYAVLPEHPASVSLAKAQQQARAWSARSTSSRCGPRSPAARPASPWPAWSCPARSPRTPRSWAPS
ncbi:MAG: ABC transporter substrate-binding protein, partial [Actinomyces dentalis]